VRQSSSEHESVGSHDTGIDLNPDDVPVGYHPSVDRLLAHRRRSRSVAASRSAAADSAPRMIDADDETDDPSVVGKDAAPSSRRSTSRSASFDKTMEWLMTRTSSKCPPAQFPSSHNASLSHSSSQLYDAAGFDDTAAAAVTTELQTTAECDSTAVLENSHFKPDDPSRSSSPQRSVCQPQSEHDIDDADHRLPVSSDNLHIGLRRRVADGSTTAVEHIVSSDVSNQRHPLQLQASRQMLMSSVDSETGVRNTRRSKQKVSYSEVLLIFGFILHFFLV